MTIMDLPLEAISPSDLNPRRHFDADDLQRLADNIKEIGLSQPIVVWPAEKALFTRALKPGATYLLAAGERRLRAHELAGLPTIRADVRDDLTDKTALQITVSENLQRANLTAIEEAHAYDSMRRLLKMKINQIAANLGRDRGTVGDALALLHLPQAVQDLIDQGTLSKAHAHILLDLKDFPEICTALANWTVQHVISPPTLKERYTVLLAQAGHDPGLTRAISYPPFDVEICHTCPFHAYRPHSHGGVCLKPAHYDELVANAQALRDQETETYLRQARARHPELAGTNLDDLTYGDFEDLTHQQRPPGCSDECPCFAAGLRGGQPIMVCKDPKRFRSLKSKAARDETKRARADAAELRTQLVEDAHTCDASLDGFARRALVVIARQQLSNIHQRAGLRDALRAQGQGDWADMLDSWSPSNHDDASLRAMMTMQPSDILALVSLAVTFDHIAQKLEFRQYPWLAHFLLDGDYDQRAAFPHSFCSKCGERYPCRCTRERLAAPIGPPPTSEDQQTAEQLIVALQQADARHTIEQLIDVLTADLDRRGIALTPRAPGEPPLILDDASAAVLVANLGESTDPPGRFDPSPLADKALVDLIHYLTRLQAAADAELPESVQ